jgi:hypothetical protein
VRSITGPGGLVSEGTVLECARIFLMEGRSSSLSSESEISQFSRKVDAFQGRNSGGLNAAVKERCKRDAVPEVKDRGSEKVSLIDMGFAA